jgi:hypothetical protein
VIDKEHEKKDRKNENNMKLQDSALDTAQRKDLYDESYRWMDEWLVGRRDVDLAGNRRTGGGPAGHRDYQVVKEIIVRSRSAGVRCWHRRECAHGPHHWHGRRIDNYKHSLSRFESYN